MMIADVNLARFARYISSLETHIAEYAGVNPFWASIYEGFEPGVPRDPADLLAAINNAPKTNYLVSPQSAEEADQAWQRIAEDLRILDSGGRARDIKSVKRAETAFVAWWMRETGFLPVAKELLRASRLPVGYVTLRHCFYAQQIVDNLPQNGSLNALEIGAGGGALKQLLRQLAGDRFGHYVIVDLPQMLCMSIGACMAFQPDEPLAIADSGPETPFPLGAQHIFVPAGVVAGLEGADIAFDLTVNTHSFQEMDDTIVAEYFDLIYKKAAKRGLFFNTNWRQSQMTRLDGSTYDNDPANYPYRAADEVLFHAPDPLHQTLRERWNLKGLIDTRTSIRRLG